MATLMVYAFEQKHDIDNQALQTEVNKQNQACQTVESKSR